MFDLDSITTNNSKMALKTRSHEMDTIGEPKPVIIVAAPGTSAIEVAGAAEAFRMTADKLREAGRSVSRGYEIHLLSAVENCHIDTSAGFQVIAHASYRNYVGPIDTLLCVGGVELWTGRDSPDFMDWLRATASRARRFGSVCTGAFMLAEAGLLNGERVTTHWFFCERLARDYPTLVVDPEPIFIRNGRLSTTAGVTAGLDLALSMIEEDLGLEIALRVARALVLYIRRPGWQSQFSAALALQAPARMTFRELPFWILENLRLPLSVEELADRVSMSTRNFARGFSKEYGVTPLRFVTRLRVELAHRLLGEGVLSRATVAAECGFGSVDALERALKRNKRSTDHDLT